MIIFSCIFGNYDRIKDPLYKDPNATYILFTDNPNLKSNIWQIKYVDYKLFDKDPQRAARYIKINTHLFLPENHQYSVWVDSCYEIRVNRWKYFIELNLGGKDISTYSHPKRDCAYEELEVCKGLKLDKSYFFEKQKEKYLKENFPKNFGLYHTAVLIRRNVGMIKNLNELWWEELNKYSKRDQISFSYCLWKLKIEPIRVKNNFGITLYRSKYFKKHKHIQGRVYYE